MDSWWLLQDWLVGMNKQQTKDMYVYMYVHIHIYIYIYMYTYEPVPEARTADLSGLGQVKGALNQPPDLFLRPSVSK